MNLQLPRLHCGHEWKTDQLCRGGSIDNQALIEGQDCQARSKDFLKAGTYACTRMQEYGGLGHAPQEILEIRWSEIASEAILGQKQSHSSYMVREVFHRRVVHRFQLVGFGNRKGIG